MFQLLLFLETRNIETSSTLHIICSGTNQLRACLDIKYFSEFHMVSKIYHIIQNFGCLDTDFINCSIATMVFFKFLENQLLSSFIFSKWSMLTFRSLGIHAVKFWPALLCGVLLLVNCFMIPMPFAMLCYFGYICFGLLHIKANYHQILCMDQA